MEKLIRKMGGRKVVFILLLVLAGLIVDLMTPRGLSEALKDLMTYLGGFFVAGNGVSKIAGALGNKAQGSEESFVPENLSTSEPVDLTPVMQRLESIEQVNIELVNNVQLSNQVLSQLLQRRQ